MKQKINISNHNLERIRSYLATQPVEKAWLFGSYARGEETRDSDIDILVEFVPNSKIGLLYFKMIVDLEELCHRRIDMAEASMLDTRILLSVENDKVLIYERSA